MSDVNPAVAHNLAFAAAAVATFAVCLLARHLGVALSLMDRTDGRRKLHARPTPLVGGVAALTGIAIGSAVLVTAADGLPSFTVSAAVLVLAGFAIGLADDRYELGPAIRLGGLGTIMALTAAVQPELNIRVLDLALLPLDSDLLWLSVPFTAFSLLCLQNGLNMADGVDGLAPSIILVWLLLILPFAMDYTPATVPLLAVATLSMTVVTAFNWFGRLFLGDAGAYGLSLLVGALAIHVYNAADGGVPAELVGLWFAIPVLDMGRVAAARVFAGHNPLKGGRDHFHHHLLRLFNRRTVVLIYLGLVGLPPAAVWLEPDLLGPAIGIGATVYATLLLLTGHAAQAADKIKLLRERAARVPGGVS
jgi:UDP-GlcNAc:undecaprenyl-phosphate GlcNAc-1-phosphate transferase